MKRRKQESLFQECSEALRPMLWRLTGAFVPAPEREDLLQEIYLQLWLALPRFEGRSKLSTWAYRVALNTALKRARHDGRAPAIDPVEKHAHHLRSAVPGNAPQRLAEVHEALRSLGEADRTLLLLALEEMPRREMAETLGISENAAQVRLHRARKRLNQALERIPA